MLKKDAENSIFDADKSGIPSREYPDYFLMNPSLIC